jgi:hypothetical protein
MHSFILSINNPEITLSLKGSDSFLHISRITLSTCNEFKKNLSNIISSFQLTYEHEYKVYNNTEGRFIDDKKQISQINFTIDPYQSQPVFDIDLKITNEKFRLGINPNQIWFNILKIKFVETRFMEEDFELKFDVESHNITE